MARILGDAGRKGAAGQAVWRLPDQQLAVARGDIVDLVRGDDTVGFAQQQAEFLAAIAAHHVAAAQLALHQARELDQHFIAKVVPVRVVDALEEIQVDDGNGHGRIRIGLVQNGIQAGFKMAAVVQARQVVAHGLFLQAVLQRIDVQDLVRQFAVQVLELDVFRLARRLQLQRLVALGFQAVHFLFQVAHQAARGARRLAAGLVGGLVLLQETIGNLPFAQLGIDLGQPPQNLLLVKRVARPAQQAVRLRQRGQRLRCLACVQVQLAAHQPRMHLLFQILAAARVFFGAQQQLQGAIGLLQQDGGVRGNAE